MIVRLCALLATAVGLGIVGLAVFQTVRAPERLAVVEISPSDVVVDREQGTAPADLRITNLGRNPVRCVGLGLDCIGASHFRISSGSLHTMIEPGTTHTITCNVSCSIDREVAFDVRVYLADAQMTWETVLSVTTQCQPATDDQPQDP
jgi:hypothetical protein